RRGPPGQPGQPGAQNPGQGGPPLDPQAMRQQMEQMRAQIEAQRAEAQQKVESGLAEILRPDQAKRLHQLDLQWRSALALADPKVAEETQGSQGHGAVVAGVVGELLRA